MRKKTKRQTKIQKNEVTKIRAFMKGVTKTTPEMINKAQQAAMHYMNVRNAILEEVLKERTGLKTTATSIIASATARGCVAQRPSLTNFGTQS